MPAIKTLKKTLKPTALIAAMAISSSYSLAGEPLIETDNSISIKEESSKLSRFFNSMGYSFNGISDHSRLNGKEQSSLTPLIHLATPDGIAKSLSRIEIPLTWETFTIKPGQSLSVLFGKAGLDYADLLEVLGGEGEASSLGNVYVGETIKFGKDNRGDLAKIELERDGLESLVIERSDDGYSGKTVVYEPDIKHRFAYGKIDQSLSRTGQQSGLKNKTIMDLASIFAWDIDFAKDIRKGDEFHVVYEELYRNGKKVGVGDVLSVKFINKGKAHEAVLYTDSTGVTDYFTPEGKSLRKAFLRSPVDFARISSHFNLKRKHPILHTIRAHKGTDYAAAPGTPIKASGDGKIIKASSYGGYGNTVIIQHGGKTTTLYAHMQKFAPGIYAGKRIKQGDVIGYIGSSGLATGPHLHYEFRVNGKPKDPVNVELADANPIPKSEMHGFKLQTQPLMLALETKSQGVPTSYAQLTEKAPD